MGRRGGGGGGGRGAAGREMSLSRISAELTALLGLADHADVRPTTQALAASEQAHKGLENVLARWNQLKTKDVAAVNEQLKQAKLLPIGP